MGQMRNKYFIQSNLRNIFSCSNSKSLPVCLEYFYGGILLVLDPRK